MSCVAISSLGLVSSKLNTAFLVSGLLNQQTKPSVFQEELLPLPTGPLQSPNFPAETCQQHKDRPSIPLASPGGSLPPGLPPNLKMTACPPASPPASLEGASLHRQGFLNLMKIRYPACPHATHLLTDPQTPHYPQDQVDNQ